MYTNEEVKYTVWKHEVTSWFIWINIQILTTDLAEKEDERGEQIDSIL